MRPREHDPFGGPCTTFWRGERMRRTSAFARRLGWSLLLGLCMTLGAGAASAQDSVPVVVIPIGTTKVVEMSKQQDIAKVQVENPKICTVQVIKDNRKAV